MTDHPAPPLDLTPIRARLEKADLNNVLPAELVAELSDWDEPTALMFAHAPSDLRALLAEVDRLRALESYWQINHHAIRNDWTAAEKRAESAEARLAAVQALSRYTFEADGAIYREDTGEYVRVADLDAALAGQGREPSQK